MKISFGAGALAIALAAGSALVVPLALPAQAAALKSSVVCKTQSSPPLKAGASTSTFAGCTTVLVGGTGKTPKTPPAGTKKGQVALVITWKGGKGTTAMSIGFNTSPSLGKCAKGTLRLIAVGKVISATGAAKAITKKGEPVTAHTCVVTVGAKAGKSSLEPGTTFKL